MKRMLSHNDALDVAGARDLSPQEEGGRHTKSESQDQEMLVVLHQIQPTDSLPGVALKYGISLAELRRANQLWASDPIHLREMLYIPVDKARNVQHLRSMDGVITTNAGSSRLGNLDTQTMDGLPSSKPAADDAKDAEKYTLRRVPASQLAFFPPPTNRTSLSRSTASSAVNPLLSQTLPARRAASNRPPIPGFPRPQQEAPLKNVIDLFSTSLHATANHLRAYAQSQSSLFSSPRPVKLSQSLASRLSIDSTSASATASSEEGDWEHEMESLGRGGRPSGGESIQPNGRRAGKERERATLRARKVRSASPEEKDSLELDSAPFAGFVDCHASTGLDGASASTHSSPSKHHRRSSSSRSQPRSHSRLGSSSSSVNGHRKVVPYMALEDEAGALGGRRRVGAVTATGRGEDGAAGAVPGDAPPGAAEANAVERVVAPRLVDARSKLQRLSPSVP
ncbi:hypothetical protein BN946_scf184876.g4 [Trametes cinnabarina]|uniref:LysM domain-containing protein n=1 Tax=Pycnoporus cinnabarinus TaxID=5643 RepID=A0A060SPK3_PYCCI|nr:hypothetical protein BN946_scf184876.g4 [Trametes cinnabarina]